MTAAQPYTMRLKSVNLSDISQVGGKNASLGEMLQCLDPLGIRVPDGFAVTSHAFREHLRAGELDAQIYPALKQLNSNDVTALAQEGARIRKLIGSVPLPSAVSDAIVASYREMSAQYGDEATDVAVRSSATAEDLPTASFAGQQDTYLNVQGEEALLKAVRDCMASLFTDRAIVYRNERGFEHEAVSLSVGVQKMVRSDLASAGVIFTLDTETGFRDVVLVTGAWGLGETVVQGRVNPDEFWVHKPTLAAGHRPILRKERGDKAIVLRYARSGGNSVREERVPRELRRQLVLTDDEVLTLARWAVQIEEHYSKRAERPTPMDIEWAKDGRSGELYIVQARPETVHAQAESPHLELFRVRGQGEVLVRGKSVGGRVACGQTRVIHGTNELSEFKDGEVLVAQMTDPDWEPVLKRACAVVTDQGGRTCHAAIVARELGIPCIVGTGNGSSILEEPRTVTVSCAEGDEGKVYQGKVDFVHEEVDPKSLPTPRVPVMLNVGNPETAFLVCQLPSAGVGLARLEFIVAGQIGIHPMALLHPERLEDPEVALEIKRRVQGYESRQEFFVQGLASGVAQISAAFYPRPVIVRMSDFKSNEYAGLLGGKEFEPEEHNPMIGFRGASRYYDERYREAFALECAAIHRVRNDMGLTNTKIMIPFCRTLEEGHKVIAELARNGLVRGENGLEVYVMCEIPNNVILAEGFSQIFDGFSIGSNDLTQLTLGVDRDSELLSHVFDEQDEGVKEMIRMVIERAHKHGRKVGLCGQGPSDHPQFAKFLADAGIDSISVTSDALPKVVEILR